MTKEQKVIVLSQMMGDDGTPPAVLEVYLDLAGQKILNRMYPYKDDYTGLEVPARYDSIQLKAACLMLNKRGAESEIQHIENGIHRNYGDADIPNSLLAEITPYCQAIR